MAEIYQQQSSWLSKATPQLRQEPPKQGLKFKRPPPPSQPTAPVTQQNTNALRRVSSARMQNVSVSESLHQFMTSRSNSAIRSTSRGALSQNEDTADGIASCQIQTTQAQDSSTKNASSSMERVEKYLRRDGSSHSRELPPLKPRAENQQKPPRASSQNTSKQVRFDIKDGLRELIKESAPAFNAAQVHRKLLERQRRKQENATTSRLSAEDLKMSQKLDSDQLKASRNASFQQNHSKASPVFGDTHRGQPSSLRKMTPTGRERQGGKLNSTLLSCSSARRYQQLVSPKSSSSKKFAYGLALKYQKESLESKVKKGQIDLTRFNADLETETPQEHQMQPPEPHPMTNLVAEIRQPEQIVKVLTSRTEAREQWEKPKKQQSASSQRKAGSIFRVRSGSPVRARSDSSGRATCDEEAVAQINAGDDQENLSANRTFYAGQIVKLGQRPGKRRNSQSRASFTNKQLMGSAENMRLQPQNTNSSNNTYIRVARSEALSPGAFQRKATLDGLPDSIEVFPASVQDQTTRGMLSQQSAATLPVPGPLFYQPEESAAFFHKSDAETEQSQLRCSAHFANVTATPMPGLWDFFTISEADFLALTPAVCLQVEASKQALHEPLKQDEEAAGLSSARQAHQGVQVPRHRLHLIRVHLRNVLLDSFLPLIHEIIQLRDRYAFRKHTYRLSIRQPLKANIISDICSRISQKLVLKVLFFQSQFKKNLHSLFTAYLDLLVKKQIVRATFDHLRTFRQRMFEKSAYLEYAKSQLLELRKLQAFDAMKRFGPLQRLEREKLGQARKILGGRLLKRVVTAWKMHIVHLRVDQIGHEMVERFRIMKRKHQLFADWVDAGRVSRRIKAKALRLAIRQQDDHRRDALYTDSDFATEQSLASLGDTVNAQAWLSGVKARSEEIFYRHIQELLLEKEHHQTVIRGLRAKMMPRELDSVCPLMFDQGQNPELWHLKPSQAYLSNKEQIYTQFPELQKSPLTAVPPSLLEVRGDPAPPGFNLTKSFSELQKALEPPLHKYMVCPQPPDQMLQSQQFILNTKYSIHQALVVQQNLFGPQSTSAQKAPSALSRLHSLEETTSKPTQPRDSSQDSLSTFPLQSSEKLAIRAVPFKRQMSIPNVHSRQANSNQKAPNQLFSRLQRQNEAQVLNPVSVKPQQVPVPMQGTKLPIEVQLQGHIRSMLILLRQCELREESSRRTIRAKAMVLALRQASHEADDLEVPCEGMTMTDYMQVALQAGVSLLNLNDLQLKFRSIEFWRKQLVLQILNKDLEQYRGFQVGRAALREWHLHHQKQNMRAVNHFKTRQMRQFYSLFSKWAKANRRLVYETEKLVRSFRTRFVLSIWRRYNSTAGRERRLRRGASKHRNRVLLTKVLAGLCQNKQRIDAWKRFERRQCLLKFFKRRWLSKCRARQLLRRVLVKCSLRDQSQVRTRYQRQFDLLKSALGTWRKRVEEKQMLYKTYMAYNHYRISLIIRAFKALKNAPLKSLGAIKLMNCLGRIVLQNPFDQLLRVCAARNLKVREWKEQRQSYTCRQFLAHLHAMAVKTKIAKLFVQRKFLKALQTYVFKHNYVRPLAFREHQLRSKAFDCLKKKQGQRWKHQRMEIVARALQQRKRKQVLQKYFSTIQSYALQEKRERIIWGTVYDFRKHTLLAKSFNMLALNRKRRQQKALLKEIADISERFGFYPLNHSGSEQ